jgi:hypothetical protein
MKLKLVKANALIIAKCILLLLLPLKAQAFNIPNVYVFSEGDDQDSRSCNFTNASAVAKAESIFRQNRIQINSLSKYYFYINITIIRLESNDGCIANINTQLFFNENVTLPSDPQKKSFLEVFISHKSITMSGPVSNFQNRILNHISTFTEQAISSAEKK